MWKVLSSNLLIFILLIPLRINIYMVLNINAWISSFSNMCISYFSPITKHGNFTESRKSRKMKNMRKILEFLRFISYFSIVWNILKDILVFA